MGQNYVLKHNDRDAKFTNMLLPVLPESIMSFIYSHGSLCCISKFSHVLPFACACSHLFIFRADEELVDQKKYLEDSCKPKCVKPLLEYEVKHFHILSYFLLPAFSLSLSLSLVPLSSYLMYMMLGPVSSGYQHDIQYSPRLLDVILPVTSLM